MVESRMVILTDRELEAAVCANVDRATGPIRADNIRLVKLGAGSEVSAIVQLHTALPDGRFELTLEHTLVAAAINLFCKEKGIPLPRKGRKRLKRNDGDVALVIDIGGE